MPAPQGFGPATTPVARLRTTFHSVTTMPIAKMYDPTVDSRFIASRPGLGAYV